MQRPPRSRPVARTGLGDGALGIEMLPGMGHRLALGDALEAGARHRLGGERPRGDPGGELAGGKAGQVCHGMILGEAGREYVSLGRGIQAPRCESRFSRGARRAVCVAYPSTCSQSEHVEGYGASLVYRTPQTVPSCGTAASGLAAWPAGGVLSPSRMLRLTEISGSGEAEPCITWGV